MSKINSGRIGSDALYTVDELGVIGFSKAEASVSSLAFTGSDNHAVKINLKSTGGGEADNIGYAANSTEALLLIETFTLAFNEQILENVRIKAREMASKRFMGL
jgi:hypothetical protein